MVWVENQIAPNSSLAITSMFKNPGQAFIGLTAARGTDLLALPDKCNPLPIWLGGYIYLRERSLGVVVGFHNSLVQKD